MLLIKKIKFKMLVIKGNDDENNSLAKYQRMKKINFPVSYYIVLLAFLDTSGLLAQSTANYNISVTTTWNATDHGSSALGNNLPNDPHWSALALVTHKNRNEFLQLGGLASQGVQNIAELGANASFQSQVNEAILAANADQSLQSGFSPRGSSSSTSINSITVSETYPLVTFLSMIAPSPDWFIAVNSETLRSGNDTVNNGWKDTYSIELFAYDAGTDDGLDYDSNNAPSNPKVGIFMINAAPLNGIKIASATFTLNATLSNPKFENDSKFKIFPNPVLNGKVSISNFQQKHIETIEIYSVIGRLVKRHIIDKRASKIQLDLSTLNSGIYVIRINSKTGTNSSQKLILK